MKLIGEFEETVCKYNQNALTINLPTLLSKPHEKNGCKEQLEFHELTHPFVPNTPCSPVAQLNLEWVENLSLWACPYCTGQELPLMPQMPGGKSLLAIGN